MVAVTCIIELDTGRDGNFNDLYDDITTYVQDARWNIGMGSSYERMAQASRLDLTLDNVGGEFRQDSVGAELLTNGNFSAWSGDNPTGWTVTGESGSDPMVNEVGAGELHGGTGTGMCNLYSTTAALSLSQTILAVGERYTVSLDIDSVGDIGGVVFKSGSTAVSPVYHLGGHKVFSFWATDTSFVIAADNGNGTVDVTLDNISVKPAARYHRALRKGTLVRLRATAPAAATLWQGVISSTPQDFGTLGARKVRISASDGMQRLNEQTFAPSLMTNVTADTAIAEIFDTVAIPWPYANTAWMLGVEGASELGTTTYLYANIGTTFDTGTATFEFTGDNLDRGNGISPLGFIRDLMEAEVGRFFFNSRDNTFTLHSRNRDFLNTTVAAALNENDYEIESTDYSEGDTLVNHATVSYQPRSTGAAGTVVWEAATVPFAMNPNSQRTFTARYQDTENPGARVGVQDIITPTPDLDYVAESNAATPAAVSIQTVYAITPFEVHTATSHGFSTNNRVNIWGVRGMNGVNGTHTVTVINSTTFTLNGTTGKGSYLGGGLVSLRVDNLTRSMNVSVERGAASSKVTVINTSKKRLYVTALRLRGTPITVYDKRFIESRNGDSARDYEYAPQAYDLPAVGNEDYAQEYANFMVYRFGTPFSYFRRLTFSANKDDTRMSNALSRAVGDRITVSEAWTGHSRDYFIVGAFHSLHMGGDNDLICTWTLKPTDSEQFWILGTAGYSELGTTTKLGF